MLEEERVNQWFYPKGGAEPFFMGEAGMTGGPVPPQGGKDSQSHICQHNYGVWLADYLD